MGLDPPVMVKCTCKTVFGAPCAACYPTHDADGKEIPIHDQLVAASRKFVEENYRRPTEMDYAITENAFLKSYSIVLDRDFNRVRGYVGQTLAALVNAGEKK